jgi:hypothetical protein
MAFAERADNDRLFFIKCPLPDDYGCDHMPVMKGYCIAGLHCIENCAYAWISSVDDA